MGPKVSVLMSVYNAWPYLPEAVESVLTQSINDFEFIIINDGSTDEGVVYLDSIKDLRVKVIHQENEGLGKALNKWLHSCKGEFIMRMDADDRCSSRKMEKQVEYLRDNKDVILVGTQIRFFAANNVLPNISKLPTSDEAIVQGMRKGWHTMCHPTIMFRKSLLDHMEGYVVAGVGEDWAFILDASEHGRLENLGEELYYYRIHPSSNAWRNSTRVIAGLKYAIERIEMREKGNDYPFELFMEKWNKQGFLARLIVNMKGLSQVLHRQAVMKKLQGRRFSSLWRMVVAALLDINRTSGAVLKRLGRNTK